NDKTNTMSIRRTDLKTGKALPEIKPGVDEAESLAFAPDGKVLAVASYDGGIVLRDGGKNKDLQRLKSDEADPTDEGQGVAPDGKKLAVLYLDGATEVWDAAAGKRLWRAGGSAFADTENISPAFAPDGKTVIASPGAARLSFRDAATGELVAGTEG